MSARCAVFSCLGLGDGLIALVLAHNLYLNGSRVTLFHPSLKGMHEWFPTISISPFPKIAEIEERLKNFDRFFIIYEKSPWMHAILELCQKKYPLQTIILNPIATLKTNYPYWEGGRFNGAYPFVDNLYAYCRESLQLPVVTKSNGIIIPNKINHRQFPQRVVIHPTSSRLGKNWPSEKFINLAFLLKARGLDPVFILTQEEKKQWPSSQILSQDFSDLAMLAAYVAESGYMIGNDSGIGHLASCLGLPTLTVCRSQTVARFWRPAWSYGKVVAPSGWIPNIKGLRLRDQYWKKWVTVASVLSQFMSLVTLRTVQK